jgi:hypothetical protein
MPSIVNDCCVNEKGESSYNYEEKKLICTGQTKLTVSAILVARTTFLAPFGVFSKIFACCSEGKFA